MSRRACLDYNAQATRAYLSSVVTIRWVLLLKCQVLTKTL